MKNKYILIFVTILFIVSGQTFAQSLNFKLSSYFYSWERTDSVSTDNKTSHLKGYQNLLFDIQEGKWSLNTSLLAQEDIANKTGDGFDYSFYNLYIKGSNLWNALDVGIEDCVAYFLGERFTEYFFLFHVTLESFLWI